MSNFFWFNLGPTAHSQELSCDLQSPLRLPGPVFCRRVCEVSSGLDLKTARFKPNDVHHDYVPPNL